MLEAEISLDQEVIEIGDKVCWQIMKDFEGEDRSLVFDEGVVIWSLCLGDKASSRSEAVL